MPASPRRASPAPPRGPPRQSTLPSPPPVADHQHHEDIASPPPLPPLAANGPLPPTSAPTTVVGGEPPHNPAAAPAGALDVQGRRPSASDEDDGQNCIICLQEVRDRTVIVTCGHDHFCFSCINVWADQSRKCPLCSRAMGEYLLHDLTSPPPFVKFFLPPFAKPSAAHPQHPALPPRRHYPRPDRGGRRRDERAVSEETDFERRLERRREIYRYGLYVKHVASNSTTRYKPVPTPSQFASNPDLISRAQVFLRREFLVWTGIDVPFMVSYVVGLMESVDVRSDAAVRLLREFLDVGWEEGEGGGRAEHFAHEVYSFLRSPFRDLKLYDAAAQYDPAPVRSSSPSRRSASPRTRTRAPASAPGAQRDALQSAFEDLVDEEGGGVGEALGGRAGRRVEDDDEDEDGASEGSSNRGRSRSRSFSDRGRSASFSRSRSRSRSRDSRPNATARHPRSASRSRSPSPRRVSRSPSPRRRPGPPLSPRRWDKPDSWVSPEEAERLAALRSRRRGAAPRGREEFPPRRASREPLQEVGQRPREGRAALPDQGAVFDQRRAGIRRGPLSERRRVDANGRPEDDRRPASPPTAAAQELMDVDPLGEGMRAWTDAADPTPVLVLPAGAEEPHEADAAAAAAAAAAPAPKLLGRISGLDPALGLRINGRAAAAAASGAGAGGTGKTPPTGPRAARTLGIRGSARAHPYAPPPPAPTPTSNSPTTTAAPPAAAAAAAPAAPVRARAAPKNVLLQRLAEAKADALRVSALKAARASAASDAANHPAQEAADAPLAAAPLPDTEELKSALPAARRPDVRALKSRILERLQAEKQRASAAESAAPVKAPGSEMEGGQGLEAKDSEEQALRRRLLARRKA